MVFSSPLLAQNWQSSPSYGADSRHHPITFSSDRYGFVMAGQNATGEYLEDAYRFDAQTETWEQIDNFPGGPRGYAYGVSNNTTAYVGFGKFNSDYPTDWWAYDIPSNQWTQLANFPSAGRSHPALILVNDKVYVGLGSNTSNLGDWWEYDIPSDTWSQKADFDFGDRHHPFYFGIDGIPYVGFGHGNSINGALNVYNDFYKYDATTDSWITLNEFPSEGRVAGTQFSYNGKGYILSGDGDDHGPLDNGELWEYIPQTDSWLQLESHPGNSRWAPGCFIINCDLYLTSGYDRINQIYFNDLIKFKLGEDCGCTDTNALNYDSEALFDDFNCCFLAGCTDPLALNFNQEACQEDSSCISPELGCTNPFSENYDSTANTLVANGGPVDYLTYGVGGFHFNDEFDMVFDCIEDVTINSVDVYAQTSFVVEIEILDANDVQIYSSNFYLNEGLNTLSLDYDLLAGYDYKIGVIGDNQGLYRNNDVASTIFPINILDYISITANTTSNPQSYFYYFYNWQLSVSCEDVYGCIDTLACNYSTYVSIDDSSCVYLDGICESCEDGIIIDNDIDDDGICDDDEIITFNCLDNACVSTSDGSGSFYSIEECEQECLITNLTWDCIDLSCVEQMNGNGEYSALADCQEFCIQTSWECYSDGLYPNCYEVFGDIGTYESFEDCEAVCGNITYNCVEIYSPDEGYFLTCEEVYDGTGTYSMFEQCEINCISIVETWRCDNGVCGVLNDGTGEYSSLEECEKECQGISSIYEQYDITNKRLLKITNVLGEKITFKKGITLFYLYDDGSVEKRLIIE